MTLAAGTRLGAYEITGTLGAGGMGEVYRARDTRLQRDVALKFLPDAFATDPERLARFRREAQLLAALNHPHIATIHGLEGGTDAPFLVMELVEGETLADRLARGAQSDVVSGFSRTGLPLDEALTVARQVAEALHAAHEKGIIHRDLKPSNIAFTAAGDVKVLDFGLAKMLEPEGTGAGDAVATHSPTLSVAATQAGVILGTASYMAPEQAKGRAVDKRADIWAFGCVLYEMLTGKRAFDGDDVTDIIGAVVRLEPDWAALPGDCPSPVRTLLRRCLDKDPRKRIADISTALFALDEIHDPAGRVFSDPPERRVPKDPVYATSGRGRIAYVAAAALVLGGVMTGSAVWLWTRPAPPRVIRTTITPPDEARLAIDGFDRDLAITPDGTRVIYHGSSALWVRPFGALDPVRLITLDGTAQGIFTSPDGQWVGYIEDNRTLKKVAITGGPAIALLSMDGTSRGATWTTDDAIIFATTAQVTGLQRVPAAGGNPTVLTRPDAKSGEADHLWPELLPGGRNLLFTITAATGGLEAAQIAVLDFATGTYKTILRGGTHARYLPSGHLVYAAAGTLRAVPFDLNRLEARGTPVPVLPRLVTTEAGAADFSVAVDGTLVYVDAPGFDANDRMLVWVDRRGVQTPVGTPPRAYGAPRLSPDGTRVALVITDQPQNQDLWIWDLERGTLTRLTFESGIDNYPVWTPDGRRLIYASGGNLFARSADGTGMAERLTTSGNIQYPTGISPDGTRLVFYEYSATAPRRDLRMLTLESVRGGGRGGGLQSGEQARAAGDRIEPVTLLETPFNERYGIVSPDGRWLAYEADPSGRYEIYVRPFPNVGDGQWQISTDGGRQPVWDRTGRELYYVAPDDALFAVPIEAQATSWKAGRPTRLFDGGSFYFGDLARMYDVSQDGQRFLMLRDASDGKAVPPQIIVAQNWLEELKRLVPGD